MTVTQSIVSCSELEFHEYGSEVLQPTGSPWQDGSGRVVAVITLSPWSDSHDVMLGQIMPCQRLFVRVYVLEMLQPKGS